MIATAAEANPSCFSPTPLVDVHRTLIPTYLRAVSSSITILQKPLTSSLLSRGISVTIGQIPNSAGFSFVETTSGPRERRRRGSRTSSQRLNATRTWTTWRETGPKERLTSRRFAEQSTLVHKGLYAQPQQHPPPSKTRH